MDAPLAGLATLIDFAVVVVSLIIPVWRDSEALADLLQQLRLLHWQLLEVLVVDGEHCADNERLCAQHQARYLVSDRGRGRQLNAAAQLARGDWLWFVHADAVLLPEALNKLHTVAAGSVSGGYFRFRFQPPRRYWHGFLEAAIVLRSRVGIPYGDQSLFVQRETFHDIGGYTEQALFEEVALVKALRRRGRLPCAGDGVLVSARRWERDGWLRRTLSNRLLATAYMLGVPAATLQRWYTSGRNG